MFKGSGSGRALALKRKRIAQDRPGAAAHGEKVRESVVMSLTLQVCEQFQFPPKGMEREDIVDDRCVQAN